MNRKLYVYDHCPFCVKARMIFGLKNIPFELAIFLNDDEETPIRMVGKKLVPILEEDGRFMGESMDIVSHIDALGTPVLTGATRNEITEWIKAANGPCYKLFLPRAASAPLPEFATTSSRAYFIRKKEDGVGMFATLFAQTPELTAELNTHLAGLANLIQSPDAVNGTLSTDDIHLYALLHSLSLIKGLEYPQTVEAYRQKMSILSGVPLLDDIAA